MDKDLDKKEIANDIINMKRGSFEEMFLIIFYSFNSYFKSLMVFGNSSKITRDCLNVIKEMFAILRKERLLLNYVLKNIDKFDSSAMTEIITILDEANDKAVRFYYNVLDDIEEAAECQQEYRGLRRKQTTPTLIQSDEYVHQVIALGESLDSIKQFLDFEDSFWQTILLDRKVIEVPVELAENVAFATPVLDEYGNVKRILVAVPKVIDLTTAKVAIKTYKKAHDLFLMLDKPYNKEGIEDSNILQERYETEYIHMKAIKTLGKRCN